MRADDWLTVVDTESNMLPEFGGIQGLLAARKNGNMVANREVLETQNTCFFRQSCNVCRSSEKEELHRYDFGVKAAV